MRKAIFVFLAGALLMTTSNVYGVEYLEKSETKKVCDKFMDEIIGGKFKSAYEHIRPYFPIPEDRFTDSRDLSIENLIVTMSEHGGIIDYKFFKTDSAGPSVLRHVYILRLKQHLLRWVFDFYKPEEGWMLDAYFWDDKLDWIVESA